MDRKKFEDAYEVLNTVEDQVEHKEHKKEVCEARAVVCFRHANSLAAEGRFRDALKRGREAQRLEPSQPVIKEFVVEMEKLAPEEENLRYLGNGQKEYEKEHYTSAIDETSRVSKKSTFYQQAQHLKSASYFHRAIEAIKKKNPKFDQAISDLKQSLALNKNREEQKVIEDQLEFVKQSQIGYELKQAFDNQEWEQAERILRSALIKETSRKYKRQIQSQLSGVLNAHAVALMNEVQEIEKSFGEALQDIFSRVKRQQGVG